MAFSTIQGSGGAPDSFVGTSGVDAIAIANTDGNFFLGALGADDVVTTIDTGSALYGGVLSNATARGGSGDDTMTVTGSGNGSTFISVWLNGNADDDTITFANGAGDVASVNTVHGGQGDDTIIAGLTGASTSLLVNGNKDDDTITSGGASSTIYGGQGNDTINIFASGNGYISGDLDNDNISLTGNVGIDNSTLVGGQGNDSITVAARTAGTDDVFINGNQGNDTLTGTNGATGNVTLYGGEGTDNITSSTAGLSTVMGGDGSDTLANAGATVDLYTSATQGGAFNGATATATIGAGNFDTVTGFAVATDAIGFTASALTGTGATALITTDSANAWNLNNNGVAVITDSTTGFTGATTYAAVTNQINLASFTGGVIGNAGDIGYIALERTAGVSYDLFAVTLGSTRGAAAASALNNSDSIAFVGNFATNVDLTATNVRFFA